MRIAALYDIHGNLPALEAVLAEIRRIGVDRIVVGGDVIPGPMPRESLAALSNADLPVDCIAGDGEREVLAVRSGRDPAPTVPERIHEVLRWNARELSPGHAAEIGSWPATLRLLVGETDAVLFCHATPRSDIAVFTRATPVERILPIFAGVDASLVICGHTHMPFDRVVGDVRVMNAGSVGMPFGQPGAHWLLLAPEPELRHTAYDLAAAAARIRRTEYPQAEEFAERHVLRPPSESEMLAAFEPRRAELGRSEPSPAEPRQAGAGGTF